MRKLILILICFVFLFSNKIFAEELTPQTMQKMYVAEYTYMTDDDQFNEREYFQTPEEFEVNKKGDCDDFAIHSFFLLDYIGYETEMYSLFYENSGHVVTVFKQHGSYNVFTNGYIIYTKEKSPVKAVKYCYPRWKSIWKFKPVKYGRINFWNSLWSDSLVAWRIFVK